MAKSQVTKSTKTSSVLKGFEKQLKTATFLTLPVLSFAGAFMGAPNMAFAVDATATPVGENVLGGSASFDRPEEGRLNINQHTDRALIEWQSFDIGRDAHTQFYQPGSSSIAVNRVVGAGADPTQILGTLKANGNVVVLDRNGVFFGQDSRVDVGGIVASTGGLNDSKFMNEGKIELTNFGDGTVENQGTITVAEGGLAALVGPNVSNSGVIAAKMGRVELAAGNTAATVDFYGDGLVEFEVTDEAKKAVASNSGVINAEGGVIAITTGGAKAVVDSVINMSGIVTASSATVSGGKIILGGGKGTTVNVSGKVESSGATGGGEITVTGDNINVASTAELNAIATSAGNGGDIVIFAENDTKFAGKAAATGAGENGVGGFIETSGKNEVTFEEGYAIDVAMGGTWLIDPTNFTINAGNVGGFTTTLDGGGNVVITTAAPGAQAGNITVNTDVVWAGAGSLSLIADNSISLNRRILASYAGGTGAQGAVTLTALGGNINSTSGTGLHGIETVAGDINLLADGLINFRGNGGFAANVISQAGDINFTATTDNITLGGDNTELNNSTLIQAVAGDITFTTGNTVLVDAGDMDGSTTFVQADAGKITIDAETNVYVTGKTATNNAGIIAGDEVKITANTNVSAVGSVVVNAFGEITSTGGDVRLSGREINLEADSKVSADKEVELTANAQDINQDATSVINAATLTGSAVRNAELLGANNVAKLGDFSTTTGTFTLNNASGAKLEVTGALTTNGNAVDIGHDDDFEVATTGSIVSDDANIDVTATKKIINRGTMDAGTGDMTLDSGSTVGLNGTSFTKASTLDVTAVNYFEEQSGAQIIADTLVGSSGKATLLNGLTNMIGEVTNFVTGSVAHIGGFTLKNAQSLNVNGDVSTEGGDVFVEVTGDVAMGAGASIDAKGGNIDVTQSGTFASIDADNVATSGTGTINLDQNVGGSIQSALDTINNTGTGTNTINVAAGTYIESVTVADSNVNLRGAQAGVDARGRAAAETIVEGQIATTTGLNDITIDGFSVDGTGIVGNNGIYANGVTNATIVNNIASNNTDTPAGRAASGYTTGMGVFVRDGSGTTTVSQNVMNNNDDGVRILNTDAAALGDVVVSDNEANNNASRGVLINASDKVRVDGNSLDANHTGVWLEASADAVVDSNTITNSTSEGIRLRQATTTDAVITNNQILDSGVNGLLVSSGTVAMLSGNTFNGTPTYIRNEVAGTNIDASNNTFNSLIAWGPGFNASTSIVDPANLTAMEKAALFELEGKTNHVMDNVAYGKVSYVTDALFATTSNLGIQAGVDASNAAGTLWVNHGTFNESVVVDKALTINGYQYGVAAQGRAGLETIVDPSSPAFRITAANVTLDGLHLTGATGADGYGVWVDNAADATLKNLIIDNVDQQGVYGDTAHNLSLTSSTINVTGSHGVWVKDSDNVTIGGAGVLENDITNTGAAGVRADDGDNVTITNNDIGFVTNSGIFVKNLSNSSIDNNVIDGAGTSGIGVNNGDTVAVDNNTVDNVGTRGVAITGGASTGITVTDNNVGTNAGPGTIGEVGILNDGVNGTVITSNTVSNTGDQGISTLNANNVTIGGAGALGNTISDTGKTAIRAEGGNTTLIDNNSVTNSVGAGIFMLNTNNATASNNIVDGATARGIAVNGGSNATVSGNTVDQTTTDGIFGTNVAGLDINTNLIGTNAGTGIGANGIFVEDSTGTINVSGNTTANTAGAGIFIDPTPLAMVRDNIISAFATFGIHLLESDGTQVLGNTITGTGTETGIFVENSDDVVIGADDAPGQTNSNTIDNVALGVDVNDGNNVTIDNNVMTNVTAGVDVNGTTGTTTITDNDINSNAGFDGGTTGINVAGAENVVIGGGNGGLNGANSDRNRVRNFAKGIVVDNASNNGDVAVSNNLIRNGSEGIIASNIKGNVTVADNNLKANNAGTGVFGINAWNVEDDPVVSTTITGNKVDGYATGIRAADSDAATITGNEVLNTENAVVASNIKGTVTVASNILTAGTATGAVGINSWNVGDHTTIDNNTLDGFDTSINAGDSASIDVTNNTATQTDNGILLDNNTGGTVIANNTLTGQSAASGAGISVSDSANVLIGGPSRANDGNVIDSFFDGIVVDSSTGATVQKNNIDNSVGTGVTVQNGSNNTLLSRNVVKDSGVNGITVSDSDDVDVDNNTAVRSASNGISVSGGSDRSTVQNNTVTRTTTEDGINIQGGEGHTVDMNTVKKAERNGVNLTGTTGGTVANNIITDARLNGISILNAVLAGPQVTDNTVAQDVRETVVGISVTNAAGTLVDGNTVIDAGISSGISVTMSDSAVITDNNVTDLNDADDNADYGISVFDSNDVFVTGNTAGGREVGIFVDPSDNVEASFNILDGNATGIEFQGATNSRILNNTVNNSSLYGILTSGDTSGAIQVAGNTLTDNATGVRLESGLIDLSGVTNTINGGDVGLQLAPTIAENLLLVGDTLGTTAFNGQNDFYIRLEDGAYFFGGQPFQIDALNVAFDGFTPALSPFGPGILTLQQFNDLEAKIFDVDDAVGRGQIFAGFVPGIAQEDLFPNGLGSFGTAGAGLSLTILGLPNVPGGTTGLGAFLNNLAPFAGGNAGDLANISPAAGGDASDLNALNPAAGAESANCWGDVGANGGQAVSINFGSGVSLDGAGCS